MSTETLTRFIGLYVSDTGAVEAIRVQRDTLVKDDAGAVLACVAGDLEALSPDVDLTGILGETSAAVAQQLVTEQAARAQAESDNATLQTQLDELSTALESATAADPQTLKDEILAQLRAELGTQTSSWWKRLFGG